MIATRTQYLLDPETGQTKAFQVRSIKGKYQSLKEELREKKRQLLKEVEAAGGAPAKETKTGGK